MWLSVNTRPIAYYVSRVAATVSNPTPEAYAAAARILRYLKGTMGVGIRYQRSTVHPQAYSDANWGGTEYERYVYFARGGPVSWSSRFQSSVALSTAEAELYA